MAEREQGSNDYEIRLLRARYHKLANEVGKLVLQSADTARSVAEISKQVGEMSVQVEAMARADEIAKEVAKRVRSDHRFYFTVGQKVSGFLFSCLVASDIILRITHHG